MEKQKYVSAWLLIWEGATELNLPLFAHACYSKHTAAAAVAAGN